MMNDFDFNGERPEECITNKVRAAGLVAGANPMDADGRPDEMRNKYCTTRLERAAIFHRGAPRGAQLRGLFHSASSSIAATGRTSRHWSDSKRNLLIR